MAEVKTKIKKKKWVQIIAPKMFKEQLLGEVSLAHPSLAVGRTINVNLMYLTGNMKKQNMLVGFRVAKIHEGKALTDIISYKIVPSLLRRLVRRGREKIEDSFVCETADNRKITVKLFLITRFAVKNSVLTAIRKSAIAILTKEAKKTKYDAFINSAVSGNLQLNLMDELRKVYPLRICEVKEIKLHEKSGGGSSEEKAAAEEAKEEEEEPKAEKKETKPKKEETQENKPEEGEAGEEKKDGGVDA